MIKKILFLLAVGLIATNMQLKAQEATQRTIEMTTTKKVGETVKIQIDAASTDQDDIWIDWDGDGKGDEQITKFGYNWNDDYVEYTIRNQNFSIIGNVTHIRCQENNLTEFDITKNDLMESVYCGDNELSELDLQQNNNLKYLNFERNKISEINLSGNPALEWLTCGGNPFTELDLSSNPELVHFHSWNNQLSTLDFSNNPKIHLIEIHESPLESINLNGADNLEILKCNSTKLKSLDVSNNQKILTLNIPHNELSACALDALYKSMPTAQDPLFNRKGTLWIGGNPGAEGSKTSLLEGKNWKGYEEGTGKGCEEETTNIAFEESVQNVSVYPNPASNYITISVPENVKGTQLMIADVSGKTVLTQPITEGEFTIYVNSFAKGIYLIKIGNTVQKLIVN